MGAAHFPGPRESCQSTCPYVQMMPLSDAIASLNIFTLTTICSVI